MPNRLPIATAPSRSNPALPTRFYNRGNALAELNRPAEALASYEQALEIDPGHPNALSGLANAAITIGDWARTKELAPRLKDAVLEGKAVIQPFVVMGYFDDNALQLRCSQNYVRQAGPGPLPKLWNGERYGHDRIRVAYLSADFHQHVTAALTAEMFELHDRAQFEITAVSFGADDGSAMRQRLVKAFEHFHDARQQSDREVATLLRQWEIDIAIDLGGHTSGARPWVLAHRPAPVQAKYMGYPGTSGSGYIDYLIADRLVVPEDQELFFSEKIAAMPDTLWVTDAKRDVPAPPTRGQAGLPEDGFVFCCFNHNWKITPPLFDIWMRLLEPGGWQRAVAAGRQCQHPGQSAQGGRGARRGAGPADFRRPHHAGTASGAPATGRPVSRHPALQCPHHRQ